MADDFGNTGYQGDGAIEILGRQAAGGRQASGGRSKASGIRRQGEVVSYVFIFQCVRDLFIVNNITDRFSG